MTDPYSTKEEPFTDEEVDQLLTTESPEQPCDWDNLYLPHGDKVIRQETQRNWTLGQTLVSGKRPHYSCVCYQDYNRLMRTVSASALKKIILHNPNILKEIFLGIAEQGNRFRHGGERTSFEWERVELIDWIIDNDLLDPNYMFEDLMKFRHIKQMNKILHHPKLTENSLHKGLTEICYTMGRGDSQSESNVRDQRLLQLFLNDSRLDPSIQDNYALFLAILHNSKYAIEKLLADGRVQACANWSQVMEAAFRRGEESMCRLVLEQTNAQFTREVLNYVENDTALHWAKAHPKYSLKPFELNSAEVLIERALELSYQDRVKSILGIALRRLRKEPEDPNIHYDDENDAYVDNVKQWYDPNK